MKTIDLGVGPGASEEFLEEFCQLFTEDLQELADANNISFNEVHLAILISSILNVADKGRKVILEKYGISSPFARVIFEITENQSAKFIITMLDEDRQVISKEGRDPAIYFLASQKDIRANQDKIESISIVPDAIPAEN